MTRQLALLLHLLLYGVAGLRSLLTPSSAVRATFGVEATEIFESIGSLHGQWSSTVLCLCGCLRLGWVHWRQESRSNCFCFSTCCSEQLNATAFFSAEARPLILSGVSREIWMPLHVVSSPLATCTCRKREGENPQTNLEQFQSQLVGVHWARTPQLNLRTILMERVLHQHTTCRDRARVEPTFSVGALGFWIDQIAASPLSVTGTAKMKTKLCPQGKRKKHKTLP